jgi:transposase
MAFREVGLIQVVDVLRRWQAGDSARAIARSTGLARDTIGKYLREARRLGLTPHGPPPTNAQLLALGRLGDTTPPARAAPQSARLEPYRDQIAHWLQVDKLQLTRIAELLAPEISVPYTTLRRFVRSHGLTPAPRDTVRMADTAPGEVAQFDFGRLGRLTNPATGKYQLVWGMNIVLIYSRHQFVWPLIHQTLDEVILGLDAAWTSFGGVPRRLIFDNFPAAVAGADALNPVFTRGFLEYSQARGFIADPARARKPRDKPHTERNVQYVRERFWKGGSFADLVDAREQARRWCAQVAGQRIHGTTRKVPLVVFREEEQAHLVPFDGMPYAVPLWGQVTVHPDHHIAFRYAIYSVPSDKCPPGVRLEVRADRDLVHIYRRGELVKIHPRKPKGGRSTDPADYPPERTTYALRAPDAVVRRAMDLGPFIGLFAERLLAGDFPWARLRQGQRLLRLADRYTAARLNAACERALAVDLLDVKRVERMLQQALEQEPLPAELPPARRPIVPSARFARAGRTFDHRFPQSQARQSEEVLI